MGLADGQAWERENPPEENPTWVANRQRALDAEDAAKWRALMSCDRIRMMGGTSDLNHIGLEFWRDHPSTRWSAEYPQDGCRERLEQFVAKLRKERSRG